MRKKIVIIGGGFGGISRDRNSDRGGFNRGRPERRNSEMHEATCSKCGKQCQVPFKPTGSKPVFCSECFGQQNDRGNNFGSRDNIMGSHSGASSEQISQINAKLDKIVGILQELELDIEENPEISDEDSEDESKSEEN